MSTRGGDLSPAATMSAHFAELDHQHTPLGELVLRRRRSPSLPDTDIYEVKLNDEFLMSSLVHASETALADLALASLGDGARNVLVGGLGLGYTAIAALNHPHVGRVDVVEYLEPVIEWHRSRLVPAADALMDDPRCRLIHDDFFDHVGQPPTADPPRYDAILVDIDHSPTSLLNSRHGRFYEAGGLAHLAMHLRSGGVFALWSAEPPADALLGRLREVFINVTSHDVTFHHPLLNERETDTVVVAERP